MKTFSLAFTEDPALRLHERRLGHLETAIAWDELRTEDWSERKRLLARDTWTKMCVSEYCSVPLMAQLADKMAQAMVPLNLLSLAAQFPQQEIAHAELCARVAARLGGATAVDVPTRKQMVLDVDSSLTPLQQASTLVLSLCCISESLSFRILQERCKQTTQPLIKAVLQRIVKEEATHSMLGWWYFDWLAESLTEQERNRLAQVARSDIAYLRAYAHGLPHHPTGDGEQLDSGVTVGELTDLGDLPAPWQATLVDGVMNDVVRPKLEKVGILV